MSKVPGPTVVDLFAGCGGLSLGLEQAGFHPVLVNELNEDALETYLLNHEHSNRSLRTRFNVRDIKTLVTSPKVFQSYRNDLRDEYGLDFRAGDLDLVVGGPPCQGYSGIGHRRSYSVDKEQMPSNFLYKDMAYVIGKLRPKAFLFENVRGLLHARWTADGRKGEIWEDVQKTFRALRGYDVYWSLVFAKQYGVPQNRPRVLLVGLHRDLGLKLGSGPDAVSAGALPSPRGQYPDLVDLLEDLIEEPYPIGGRTTHYPHDPSTPIQNELRLNREGTAVFGQGATLSEHEYSKHSPDIIRKFRHMLKYGGRIPPSMQTKKFAQRVLPARWGTGSPYITAASLSDDYVHFSQPRVLTVREWARLQLFPDWYQFAGKRTTGGTRRAGNPRAGLFEREAPKYTQIGNAVPVRLAKVVGEHLLGLFRGSGRRVLPSPPDHVTTRGDRELVESSR